MAKKSIYTALRGSRERQRALVIKRATGEGSPAVGRALQKAARAHRANVQRFVHGPDAGRILGIVGDKLMP